MAMKQLLKLMLRDEDDRPTATQLLQHPTVQFLSMICQPDQLKVSEVPKVPSAIPAFISALNLGDKNKAIIAFFSLMQIYAQFPHETFELVMQQQAYIQVIELLVICLKEGSVTLNSLPHKDHSEETLERLHLNGLNLLGDILRVKQGEPEIKMQF